eukprot:5747073-Prymnesium_polylepis.1
MAEEEGNDRAGVLAVAKSIDAEEEAAKQLLIARDAEIAKRGATDEMPGPRAGVARVHLSRDLGPSPAMSNRSARGWRTFASRRRTRRR